MRIGTFTQDANGVVTGKIRVLGIGVIPLALEQETSKKDGKPYFRIIADPQGDAYEIGAAFEKNKDGMIYHSVSIDSPVFPAALNAALFADREREGVFNLVWDRPEKKPAHTLSAKADNKADANGEAEPAKANGEEPAKAATVAASRKESAGKRRVFSKGATP